MTTTNWIISYLSWHRTTNTYFEYRINNSAKPVRACSIGKVSPDTLAISQIKYNVFSLQLSAVALLSFLFFSSGNKQINLLQIMQSSIKRDETKKEQKTATEWVVRCVRTKGKPEIADCEYVPVYVCVSVCSTAGRTSTKCIREIENPSKQKKMTMLPSSERTQSNEIKMSIEFATNKLKIYI